MRYCRLAIIVVLLLVSRPLWAEPPKDAKAPLAKDAKAPIEKKEQPKAATVPNPPLEKKAAAPEVLDASYAEAMASGRYVTAYQRLNVLLREKPQDAELHYLAMECAGMAGLSGDALDHTLSFLKMQKAENDPRVKEALASLLNNRPTDASFLDRYCRLDKKAALERGLRQIKLAQDAIKGQLAIGCGRVLLKHYTEQAVSYTHLTLPTKRIV